METDPIMTLRAAIAELTAEIRTMRGAGSASASSMRQTKDSVNVDISEDQKIPVSNQAAIDDEGKTPEDPLVILDHNLKEDVEKAQQELDELVLALGEKDRKLEAARASLLATEQALEQLEEQRVQLATEVEAFERKREQFQSLQQERAKVEEHLRVLKSEETDIEAKSRLLASREEELRIGLEKVENVGELLRKIWPDWLCGENLKHWKEQIERDVFVINSPPSFSLVFAAIHNYNASLRDPDSRILLDALRDLGRRLYQWLKDLGKSEQSIAEIAESWASAINTECAERCAIQVAVPGNPANNKWMSFTPRSGSAPDVASVRSWCVSDNQGRTIHRAEITV